MINLPEITQDNPPLSLGKLSPEEKIRGYKAIEESIKRTKLISERQKATGSNNFNLRLYKDK